MIQSKIKILTVMYDIKPVDETGRVDVAKVQAISSKLDLRFPPEEQAGKNKDLRKSEQFFFGTWDEEVGVRDLALVDGQAVKKETPAKGASFRPIQARSLYSKTVLAPDIFPSYSRASNLSTINNVDKFEAPVDPTGLAPVTPGANTGYLLYNTTGPLPGLEKDCHRRIKKQTPTKLLEKYLNSKLNIIRELKAVGAKVEKNATGKPRARPIPSISYLVSSIKDGENDSNAKYEIQDTKYKNLGENYETAIKQINERVPQSGNEVLVGEPKRIEAFEYRGDVRPSPEIESWVRYVGQPIANSQWPMAFKLRLPRPNLTFVSDGLRRTASSLRSIVGSAGSLFNKKVLVSVAIVGLSASILTSFGQYGVSVKNEVVRESNLAVANLEKANESLRVFDFEAASNNFAEAYEEFSKAGDSLNFMGASITSLLAEFPGAGKLKSAKNLVEAGKLLAEAGKSMSEAVNALSKTGAILNIDYELGTMDYGLGDLKKSLVASGKNLSKASVLLAKISLDALPEDKRGSFSEFQSKLPELEGIISDAVEYTSFLENLLGSDGTTKKYLVLFQNNSELRPTGGFPGTYAVVTFKDGRLAGFLVGDVYNLDGQLKENIIPPKPLQHITPNWGMRDANWFIDFSASAQKAMEFFQKGSGHEVDGVITVSPRMISDILKVVGPIEMPEYGYLINHENFLSTIQAEVEYGDNREQPKSVVMDMAPRLLERIYSAEPGRWLDIFNVFISGLDKKDILMYFKDLNLESFVAEKGLGGLVKETDEDYLMVTFSNVKGSKTDRVTDNAIVLNSKLETRNSKQVIVHKLTITRQHNGGNSRYGFYNKQNSAYVRILVPEGAELLDISGNDKPSYSPLISYAGTDFEQDNELFSHESGFNYDSEKGASTYKESGKTGFAFWLITDPGKRKTVELEYAAPLNYGDDGYGIYVQKQPGLEVDNFEFQVGDTNIYNGKFDKDLELRFGAE